MLHVTNKDDARASGRKFSWQMSEGAFIMQTNKGMERSVDYVET